MDVLVESQGAASSQFVECCTSALRGYRMPAASAVAGERYRLRVDLP